MHSDVGGSYPQEESGLSNISLQWMMVQAHDAGIRLAPERVNLVLGEKTLEIPFVRHYLGWLDNIPIGTAYLPIAGAKEGTKFEFEVRGKRATATVVKPPFYKNASHK